MYKFLLVPALFISFIGAEALAQTDPFNFCESMFRNERDECHAARRQAYYIDNYAVTVCDSLFRSDRLTCFKLIIDHRFDQRDLQLCRGRATSQRMSCLESVRQPLHRPPPPGCDVSYRQIERELDRIMLLLDREDTRRARSAVDRLRFDVRRCSDRW